MAEKSTGSNILANGFVWVAAVAASALLFGASESPIVGSRPSITLVSQNAAAPVEEDVDARMWQDPFSAVAKSVADASEDQGKATTVDAHKASDGQEYLHVQIQYPAPPPACAQSASSPPPPYDHHCSPVTDDEQLVLVVMLPGAPFSEAVETRRQIRYAVLSALNLEGYIPYAEDHLGYFLPPPADQTNASLDTPKVARDSSLPASIPFEEFRPAVSTVGKKNVLVVWLDEDTVMDTGKPLNSLSRLACELQIGHTTSLVVLGPWASTTLQAMAVSPSVQFSPGEATKPCVGPPSSNSSLPTLYDFGATAPVKGIKYIRTVTSDSDVSTVLIDELKNRHIDPVCHDATDHILLISEWDTFYGRSLPDTFTKDFESLANCSSKAVDDTNSFVRPFYKYSYLRGIDGQLPLTPDQNSDQKSVQRQPRNAVHPASSNGADGVTLEANPLSSQIERAEGDSQYDYLRRLADSASILDSRLSEKGSGHITAIGILGSDVYDKLAILQLLHQRFPDAQFFTTDLDARLYHPAELPWTRNLLVGSSYGLSLTAGVQGVTPPFRIVYQTSAFLATRLAVQDYLGKSPPPPPATLEDPAWASQPMLFEIGLTSPFAFPLKVPSSSHQSADLRYPSNARAGDDVCSGDDLRHCSDVQAEIPKYFLPSPDFAWFLILWLGLVVVVFPFRNTVFVLRTRPRRLLLIRAAILTTFRTRGYRLFRRVRFMSKNYNKIAFVVALTIGLLGASIVSWRWTNLGDWMTQRGYGEPLLLFSGISIWPVITVRVLSLWLCAILVFDGYRRLSENILDIKKQFFLAYGPLAHPCQTFLPWLSDIFSFSLRIDAPPKPNSAANKRPTENVQDFWLQYLWQNRPSARLCRLIIATVLLFGSALIISSVLNGTQPIARGTITRGYWPWQSFYNLISWLDGAAMFFLVAFVADATFFCIRLIKQLSDFRSTWPEATLSLYETQLAFRRDYLDEWIDLQFVANRTACIGPFIYYPFIVIAVLTVSRIGQFAYFPPNPAAWIVLGVCFASAAGCAAALPRYAEQSRGAAIDRLSQLLVRSVRPRSALELFPPWTTLNEPTREQIELLIEQIKDLRTGAFTPVLQQPIVRALLIPIASAGGTFLLQYLSG